MEPGAMVAFERGDAGTYADGRLRALVPAGARLWHGPEYMVLFGPPAEMILGNAGDDVDLIVMGVKSPTPLTKHLGEGVAYKLACEAPCPLLSVSARYHAT
jgi:nucleotide-binding universal stress UspA family protein